MQIFRHLPSNLYRYLLVIIFLFATYALFKGGNSYSMRSLRELWNLGHIAYFAQLVYLISILPVSVRFPKGLTWLSLILLSLILGAAIEIQQYGSDRSSDIIDIVRDLTGTLLALAFIGKYSSGFTRKVIIPCRILAITALLVLLVPFLIAVTDETIARTQFPVLASFNTPFELDRWTGDNVELKIEKSQPQNLLRVEFSDKVPYSGINLHYFEPNWGDYRYIGIKLLNPASSPLEITVKIYDRIHESNYLYPDRYNEIFQLAPGWNELKIAFHNIAMAPEEREMDLQEITNLSLFTVALPEPKVLYLDQIELFN